jgi:RNA polymerase primary sigma factor
MRQLTITKQITQRNEDSINRYFNEINKYDLISPEEEVELTVRIRNGDEQALERIVVANLRFVISVAKKYQNQGLSFPDLINEGNLGLVKAAYKFDETRGFKFISYAVWWIRQSIITALSEQTRVVRIPLNRVNSISKIKKASSKLEQEFEREPADHEIAAYLDMTSEDVEFVNTIKNHQVSLDKPITLNGDSNLSLYDFIHPANMKSPDSKLIDESIGTNIQRALNKLSERESMIIEMTFGLSDWTEHSLQEIASIFDMSTERVRQIKNTGLQKLRSLLAGNDTFFGDLN